MPGFDRTGPLGRGARTGRGFGLCNGYGRARYGGFRGGVGRGGPPWGGGWGRWSWYEDVETRPRASTDIENEIEQLSGRLRDLEQELARSRRDD